MICSIIYLLEFSYLIIVSANWKGLTGNTNTLNYIYIFLYVHTHTHKGLSFT